MAVSDPQTLDLGGECIYPGPLRGRWRGLFHRAKVIFYYCRWQDSNRGYSILYIRSWLLGSLEGVPFSLASTGILTSKLLLLSHRVSYVGMSSSRLVNSNLTILYLTINPRSSCIPIRSHDQNVYKFFFRMLNDHFHIFSYFLKRKLLKNDTAIFDCFFRMVFMTTYFWKIKLQTCSSQGIHCE